MPISLRPARRVSAIVATATLMALFSIGAAPAQAADLPWSPQVTVGDAYGEAGATAVAPDGSITTITETVLGITAITSTDAGASWQPSVPLGSGGDFAFRPAIGITSSGLRAASWVEETAGVRSIFVAISADGGATWSSPDPLPTVGTLLDDPVIASTSATGFTIAWSEDWDKYASSSSDGGTTWGAAQNLTTAMNSSGATKLIVTGPDQIVAVYQEFDGMTALFSIQSKRSTDGGLTWDSTVPVSGSWSGSLSSGLFVGGASPSSGTVVAVWAHNLAGGIQALFAATSADGGVSWSAPVTVSGTADYLRYFTVAAVDATHVGIVWAYELGAGSGVSYATLAIGASATSAPVTVTSTTTNFYNRLPSFSTVGSVRVVSWYEEAASAAESGFRVAASCDAGATWTPVVNLALGADVFERDAVGVVSGTTFTGIWNMDDVTPSTVSLQSSSTATPCAVAGYPIAGAAALAATGVEPAPLGFLAAIILGLGAVVVLARRRRAAA